jgi:hypothetical protein
MPGRSLLVAAAPGRGMTGGAASNELVAVHGAIKTIHCPTSALMGCHPAPTRSQVVFAQ